MLFSFGLLSAFALESLAFIVACALLCAVRVGEWPIGALLALALVLTVIVRVLYVPLSFAFAAFRRVPLQPEARIGFWRTAYVAAVEAFALLLAVFMLMPFSRRLVALRRGSVVRSAQAPVLFIHGFNANAGVWAPMLRYLELRGLTNLYTLNLQPTLGDIDDFAQQVAARVNRIRSTTRAQQVILVGHSMGGLVARAYVEQCGGEEFIAKVITIGTPHHGTVWARPVPGICTRQMRPGSEWLDALNREENLPRPVEYTSIYSPQDNVIVPYISSELGQARNVPIIGCGHFALIFSEQVGSLVYHEILNP